MGYPNGGASSSSPSPSSSTDFQTLTLAEAGLYFSPSWDDRDSVACFLCGKSSVTGTRMTTHSRSITPSVRTCARGLWFGVA
ncbi:hypothetical protein JVT61DRAFT_7182 [Boletus reticuloceps]|uniref:Uncharacterized protein n=1 Tax=Boletus reticuloceps TaxID=495285 RepID=A0A8I3A791_9AGAM|nr:hypothetical protein JVT61DRAFT_7182 [Boletus reticuloceps]